jgi:uncharacterized protein (UPF0335 family)
LFLIIIVDRKMEFSHYGVNDSHLSSVSGGAGSASSTTSSKAVLAALRALQDKIRRLESEKVQAQDEVEELKREISSQQVESNHMREKVQLDSERSLEEAKSAYNSLLNDKSDLEAQLAELVAQNKEASSDVTEMESKLAELVELKKEALAKESELDRRQREVEHQLSLSQLQEQEMAQKFVMANQQAEQHIEVAQAEVMAVRAQLDESTQERTSLEAKIGELDKVIAQLLHVNENLVSQISGQFDISGNGGTTTTKTKKSSKRRGSGNKSNRHVSRSKGSPVLSSRSHVLKPTEAYISSAIEGIDMAQKSRARGRTAGRALDADMLSQAAQAVAEMSMSASLELPPRRRLKTKKSKKKGIKPKRSTSSSKKDSSSDFLSGVPIAAIPTAISSSSSRRRPSSASRLGSRRAAQRAAGLIEEALRQSVAGAEQAAGVMMDDSDSDSDYSANDEKNDQSTSSSDSYNADISSPADSSASKGRPSSAPAASRVVHVPSARTEGAGSGSAELLSSSSFLQYGSSSAGDGGDLQSMIASLENEFDSLNGKYRALLSSVAPVGQAGGAQAVLSNKDTAQSLVSVLRQMHQKGEQLRALKSPERK